jgi:lysine biosynthesis protein LysW
MPFAACASCGAKVNVGKNPELGQRFTCPSCDDVMEVVWLDPIELDWPIDDDEDYDDYDDEDFEDDEDLEDDEDFEDDEEEG